MIQAGGMQKRSDAGRFGCRKGGMQERREARKEGCRTRGIKEEGGGRVGKQERWD